MLSLSDIVIGGDCYLLLLLVVLFVVDRCCGVLLFYCCCCCSSLVYFITGSQWNLVVGELNKYSSVITDENVKWR